MTILGGIASQIRNPNPNPHPARHTGRSLPPFPIPSFLFHRDPTPNVMSHRPFLSETAKIGMSSPLADQIIVVDPDGRALMT